MVCFSSHSINGDGECRAQKQAAGGYANVATILGPGAVAVPSTVGAPKAAPATSCSTSLSLSAAWASLPSAPAPAPVIFFGELFLPEELFTGLGGTSLALAGEPSATASNAVENSLACGGSLTWLIDSGTTSHFSDGVLVLCIAT